MVIRGTLDGQDCIIRYIDAHDIMQFLDAVHVGKTHTRYRKNIAATRLK